MNKITGSTSLLHELANDNEKISPVKWKTSKVEKVEEADFYLAKCKDRLGAPAGAVYPGIGLIFVGVGLYLTINGILEHNSGDEKSVPGANVSDNNNHTVRIGSLINAKDIAVSIDKEDKLRQMAAGIGLCFLGGSILVTSFICCVTKVDKALPLLRGCMSDTFVKSRNTSPSSTEDSSQTFLAKSDKRETEV